MTMETQKYSRGGWIVHLHHGVGQIQGTQVMCVGGQKNQYCRIRTRNSTIWMPLEKLNADWLRPLASPAEFQQALVVLGSAARPMDTDINRRKRRINNVKLNNSPVVIAEILRDLWAHNKEKKHVSQTDGEALRHFKNLFLAEWSVCMSLEMSIAKQQLDDLLAQS
jgi:RNA polymerase-interacting CarD/CdnL/TRCF family regulator